MAPRLRTGAAQARVTVPPTRPPLPRIQHCASNGPRLTAWPSMPPIGRTPSTTATPERRKPDAKRSPRRCAVSWPKPRNVTRQAQRTARMAGTGWPWQLNRKAPALSPNWPAATRAITSPGPLRSSSATPAASETKNPVETAADDVQTGARGPASGREFDPEAAGGPIQQLEAGKARITSEGVQEVTAHLQRFAGGGALEGPEQAMLDRLTSIAAGDTKPASYDLEFLYSRTG